MKWNAKIWERILEAYPYGLRVECRSTQLCSDCTESPLPYVRGDWFVAAASRPPLYHDVLQIPGTDAELEKLLASMSRKTFGRSAWPRGVQWIGGLAKQPSDRAT